MSDPARWRDGGDEVSDDVRAWLRGAAAPQGPTEHERAAMLAVAAKIGAAPAGAAWLHKLTVAGWKAQALAGLVAVVGVSTALSVRPRLAHRDPSAHVARVSPRPSRGAHVEAAVAPRVEVVPEVVPAVAPPATSMSRPPETVVHATHPPRFAPPTVVAAHAAPVPAVAPVAVAPVAAESAPATPASTCPVPSATSSDAEAATLAAATRALSHDPAVTLACVALLGARGASDQLFEERAFLGFAASRRLGRAADAARWAQQLLTAAPTSPYAARVREALGVAAPQR